MDGLLLVGLALVVIVVLVRHYCRKTVLCPHCSGVGQRIPCSECKGSKQVKGLVKGQVEMVVCPECKGEGFAEGFLACAKCKDQGVRVVWAAPTIKRRH